MERYKKSLEYLERAKRVSPGAAQTLSKSYKRFPEGAFPIALDERLGSGACVYDLDGNCFVDWIGALGATPLGLCHPHITKALQFAAQRPCFSLPIGLEKQVVERLCSKIPCAESIRFISSGSEATEAAIRTARIATGRDMIVTVKSGYHGWHSWFQAVKDWHPGVPCWYEKMIRGTEYNNAEAIETLLFWAEDAALVESQKVAAVIMEPTLFEQPKEGYLQAVRDACSHYGTLLIFDEVVCGGRWAYGGGQEYFGVTPDLACFGKGLANGLPVGILCGKREYMRHAELVSGTFGGNGLSLAAVAAVLDVYEAEPVIETMWKRGKELQNHFDRNAKLWNIPAVCDGYPCKPRIRFLMHEDLNQQAMALFLQVCAEEGVLFHPGGFNVCAALTDDDMQQTRAAVVKGLTAIAISIKHNDWSALKGHLCQPVVTVRG